MLVLLSALDINIANAQNLVTNGDFEVTASTYTVVESATNVLMSVSSIYDVTIQGPNPVATVKEAVATGQWVKRALDGTKV